MMKHAKSSIKARPLYVLLLRNLKNYDEAVEFVGKGARGG